MFIGPAHTQERGLSWAVIPGGWNLGDRVRILPTKPLNYFK